jgi:hypothetical protein
MKIPTDTTLKVSIASMVEVMTMTKKKNNKMKYALLALLLLIAMVGLGYGATKIFFQQTGDLTDDDAPTGGSSTSSGGASGSDEGFFAALNIFEWFIPTEETAVVIVTPECVTDFDCSFKCASGSGHCMEDKCSCTTTTPTSTDIATDIDCTDSDHHWYDTRSTDYYLIKGTCTDSLESRGLTDSCARDTLTEYYCSDRDNKCHYVLVNCVTEYGEYGFCDEGACSYLV